MASNNAYYKYYSAQLGGGTVPYYHSKFIVQGGHGWFGNIFRSAWGLLRPLAKHIGSEALNTGGNIMREAMSAAPQADIREIVKRQGREGLANLAQKAASTLRGRGGGCHRKRRRRAQTPAVRRGRRTTAAVAAAATPRRRRRRRKKTSTSSAPGIRDIFSPPTP